jgi:hypothetical protein
MSLSERILQLNREIGATVEHAITELRQEISQRLRDSNEEIHRRLEELTPSLPASFLSHEDFAHAESELGRVTRRSALRTLRDGLAGIDRARSQAEILTALLRESARYASRTAMLLARGGEIRGWGSEGFGEAESAIRGLALSPADGPWGRVLQGEGAVHLAASDCAELCSRVESPLPREGVLVPVVLRDRVAAALYADRLEEEDLSTEALQILTYAAAQAIETLPFRERATTPTLADVEEEGAGWDQPQPAPAPVVPAVPAIATIAAAPADLPAAAPAPSVPVAPEVPEVENVAEVEVEAEPEATSAPWTAEDEQSAVSLEPEPAPAEEGGERWDAAPRYTEELAVPSFAEAAPTPASVMQEDVPRYPRSVEPEPVQAAPVQVAEVNPQATVLLQRSVLQQATAEPEPPPAPAPQPLRPVAVPEEPAGVSPLAAGTPEVRPPSGVDGPGWAFSTTRVPVAPNNEALHEEARRLARLLVSEIKLYNEEQVDEGRRNRDIYERLKEDIDRSRQMYDERVDPQILRSTDYFYQELVRILAAGDSKALGI